MNVALLPFAVILLVFIGCLIAGLILLAVQGGRAGRIIAGTAAVLIVFGGLGLVGLVSLQTVRSAEINHSATRAVEIHAYETSPSRQATSQLSVATTRAVAPPHADAIAALDATTTWRLAGDFMPDAEADLYPSQRAAEAVVARAVASAIGTSLGPRLRSSDPNTLVVRILSDQDHSLQSGRSLVHAIGKAGVPCRVSENLSEEVDLLVGYDPKDQPVRLIAAIAEHAINREPVFQFGATFVDKPWLTDLAAQREIRDQPDLLVGVSPTPEATEADAHTAALRSLALQLAPRLADARPAGTYDASIRHIQLDSVVRRLRQVDRLQDRFTQRLKRPYGTVYRAAVLADVTPDFIQDVYHGNNHTWTSVPTEQQLAAAVDTPAAPSRTASQAELAAAAAPMPPSATPRMTTAASVILRLLGLAVLALLTLLIYLGLDRWTRGYRPVLLSTGAIALLLGGAALLGLLSLA